MGVINITPDSFSDGGDYLDPIQSIKRVDELISAGVDVIDIGAQSTRPKAIEIGPDEEIRRLNEPIRLIRKKYPELIISVDTYHSNVATFALQSGANWINDISSARHDPQILKVVAQANCPYIITHSRGNSQTMDQLAVYHDLVEEVSNELRSITEKALVAGINKENIIWDLGLGFAKTNSQNIRLLRNINQFHKYGYPILLGPSRKRFIGELLNESEPKNRDWGTAGVAMMAELENIAILRVHNLKGIKQMLLMYRTILNQDILN